MRIEWTSFALANASEIYEYIRKDNASAAVRVLRNIRGATEVLRKQPLLGRPGRILGSRELIVTGLPYVILYQVKDDRVEVLSVLHGKQRWPEAL